MGIEVTLAGFLSRGTYSDTRSMRRISVKLIDQREVRSGGGECGPRRRRAEELGSGWTEESREGVILDFKAKY